MIPKLHDYAVKAWDKSKPYISLILEIAWLNMRTVRFWVAFVIGLIAGQIIF